jgi:AcrR family transcriptional regulator
MTGGADQNAPRGRARRADAARNAGVLLAAAKELFDEFGPDVPLDDVARRAGLGNATLYRHFPTRSDLLVAVYADEVTEVCRVGAGLLEGPEPPEAGEALYEWLAGFVVHVATKRALALAITESPDGRCTELFDQWHSAMRSIAHNLLLRAKAAGAVRSDAHVGDLLSLTSGAAIVSTSPAHARELLRILWRSFETPGNTADRQESH